MINRYCAKCGRPIRAKLEIGGDGKYYHNYCLWGFLTRAIRKLEKSLAELRK